MDESRGDITDGPGEPDRTPPAPEETSSSPHTGDDEGHPAGDGERSDREVGGPTSPDDPPEEDVSGSGTSPRGSEFEPHGDE